MLTHDGVVIVRAGPVGLIAAHELVGRNIALRLIDKRPGPSHATRAFTLHARTMEIFEHIGVAHRTEEVVLECPDSTYHSQAIADADKPRTDFRGLQRCYPFYYKINQNDFEQVLPEHLLAHYDIRPEYGQDLTDLVQDSDGIIFTITDHTSAQSLSQRCAWVIGSDGAHSRVHGTVGIDFIDERVGVIVMMDVEIQDFGYDDSWVNYFIGDSLFMLVTRLPGDIWRLYLGDAGAMTRSNDPPGSFQAVADQIGIGMHIGEPRWITQWEILNSAATRYQRGRVLLCGNDSHVHPPAGRQGVNRCMQDAFNLGWKLAAVIDGAGAESLLDTYEAERRPIGEQITAGARTPHDIVTAFVQELADRIALTRQPGWQQRTVELISGLSHNYRDTALPVPTAEVPGRQAGDQAPDAQFIAEPRRRLFDLFRHSGFTPLLAPRTASPHDIAHPRHIVNAMHSKYRTRVSSTLISEGKRPAFGEDHAAPDQLGESAQRYAIEEGEPRAIVVRPDMYIDGHCKLQDRMTLVDHLGQCLRTGEGASLAVPSRKG